MTWKERRTVTMLTTILLVLAAMLLVVLGIRYRQHRAETEDGGNAGDLAVSPADLSVYTALSYSNGATALSFTLDEAGVWHWDADDAFPLNDATVQEMLAQLSDWKPQQTLTDTEALEASGLSEPTATLTASTADGKATVLLFGKATTDGTSDYVRLNGDETTVYIIDGAIRRLMDVPIYDMCRLPELPVLMTSRIRSVSIQGPVPDGDDTAPVTTLTAQHSETAAAWRSDGANVTDDPLVRALMEDLTALELAKCIDYAPSDEAASICGFDGPQAILRIVYTPDGQEDAELVLTVGQRLPDKSGRYVRLNGEAPIYLLETELLDPLMRIAVSGL